MIRRWLVGSAVMAILMAGAVTANAQEAGAESAYGTLRLGSVYSFGGGDTLEHGFGMDLRYQAHIFGDTGAFLGGFTTGQYELGDAWRAAGGLSIGWRFMSLDVGIAHRTATDDFAASTGLQIGQTFTFGPVSVGGRLTLPLVDDLRLNADDDRRVQGIEGALVVTLAWGFTVHGQAPVARYRGCAWRAHGTH